MRKNNCEIVRRELDELTLDDACSSAALDHLQQCSHCREFQQTQTKLRQMVGSLGTVAAPADFDFRLRARLANDSSNAAFHLKSAYWPFARRGFAVAAMLLLIATGAVLVRNVVNQQKGPEVTVTTNEPANRPQPGADQVTQPREEVRPTEVVASSEGSSPQKVKSERPSPAGPRSRRTIVAVDLGSERAEVLNATDRVASSEIFPIDASQESFKVSLDDGRGNARTISLPTIRFGSQRMLPNGNQFAAKGVW
jgi:hypothetical protein